MEVDFVQLIQGAPIALYLQDESPDIGVSVLGPEGSQLLIGDRSEIGKVAMIAVHGSTTLSVYKVIVADTEEPGKGVSGSCHPPV